MALPYLLAENVGESGTHLRHGDAHFEKLAIDVRRNRVKSVDYREQVGDREQWRRDRLRPAADRDPARIQFKPPIQGMDSEGVENCWTLADARRILAGAKPGSRVVLMGAGFIGCIVLEALAARGVELVVVEMADRMLPRMMDETGGAIIARWCESKGITVRTANAGDGDRARQRQTHAGDRAGRPDRGRPRGVRHWRIVEYRFPRRRRASSPTRASLSIIDCARAPGTSTRPAMSRRGRTSRPVSRKCTRSSPPPSSTAASPPSTWREPRRSFRGSLSMNVLNTLGLVSSSFGAVDGGRGRRTLGRHPTKRAHATSGWNSRKIALSVRSRSD